MKAAGMYGLRGIIATALASCCLVSMSAVSHAATTTADDPGAFAALGTIYFSSVLDEAGMGSGNAGKASRPHGNNQGFTGNQSHGFSTGQTATGTGSNSPVESGAGGGTGSSDPGSGDGIAQGSGPVGSSTGKSGDDTTTSGSFPSARSNDDAGSNYDSGAPIGPQVNGSPEPGGVYSPGGLITGLPYTSDDSSLSPPGASPVLSSARILAVPEPTSIALFGAGLFGLAALSRRRTRS